MREYEIVIKFCNACAGSAHPQITFDEAELEHPDDYIRARHGRSFDQFQKEILPDGRIVYTWDSGVSYRYEFTAL